MSEIVRWSLWAKGLHDHVQPVVEVDSSKAVAVDYERADGAGLSGSGVSEKEKLGRLATLVFRKRWH
jgi:hypothetical protein